MEDVVIKLETLHKKLRKEKSFVVAKSIKEAIEEIKTLRYRLKEKDFFKRLSVDDLLEIIDNLEENKQTLIKVRNRAAEELCKN